MPLYDTFCEKCDHLWEQKHLMREAHEPCPKCHSKQVRTHITLGSIQIAANSLDAGWENEEGGRGRYFSQLEDSATCTRSPKNFFRSRNEAIEACKRRGFQILEK